MKLLNIAKKITGKTKLNVDPDIPAKYMFFYYKKYLFQLIRGYLAMPLLKKHGRSLFIGKHTKLYLKNKITFGNSVKIGDYCKIDALSKAGVWFGDHSGIGNYSVIECTGTIAYIGQGMKIGNLTNFGANCFFGAAGGIKIGNDVIGGQNIRFHSEEHNFQDKKLLIREQGVTHKGIEIGDNCWIGAGAIFLDGCNVGDGCVIASNAVLKGKFPEHSVIAGIPAKVVKPY